MSTLETVSRLSAAPWSQSTSAREHSKVPLLMSPVGMVASTKSRRKPNPNPMSLGVLLPL